MNTIKQSLLIKEHWPETEIYVFYMDMRASGKGFEDLLKRAKKEGVKFIRGLPAEILEKNPSKDLRLIGENTLLSELYEIDVELVILQTGLEPRRGSEVTQRIFNLSRSHDGFFLEAHPKLKPVDTPTVGVFLAGCAESPKDIKDSVTQASAAAARAGILMAKGSFTVEANTPRINLDECVGCGLCTKVCSFAAITLNEKTKKAELVEAACRGCGACGAECPRGAIEMRNFTDDQVCAQIDAATELEPENKTIAFCCNWCSYAGADMAGTSRIQYPPTVRIIRTMCSGRVAWKHIDRAFARRAALVLVSGCHPGDCHYMNANLETKRRVEKYWEKMERLGLDKNRLQLGWFSAAEGERFAAKITEMHQYLSKVEADDIERAASILSPALRNRETTTS
jgi:heterodisulfide reductase subunit A